MEDQDDPEEQFHIESKVLETNVEEETKAIVPENEEVKEAAASKAENNQYYGGVNISNLQG